MTLSDPDASPEPNRGHYLQTIVGRKQAPGVDIAARYLPGARDVEIGGDWYDAFLLPRGQIGLAIGDVVGQGIHAASVMGQVAHALRAYALEGHPPGEVARRLNDLLQDQMVTLLYLVLNPETGNIRYVNCGYLQPLERRLDGSVRYLDGGGSLPLGVVAAGRYSEASDTLELGSTLLLYTDGLVEQQETRIDSRLDRLRQLVAEGPANPEALCDHILEGLLAGEAPKDDVAVLALKTVPALIESLHRRLPAVPNSLPSLRRILAQWLQQHEAGPEEQFEITVAVGEAATNAVEHAYGPGDAVFEVDASLINGDVAISVRDFGAWRSPRGAHHGRGQGIMRSLMDVVEIEPTRHGTEVRMRRRLRRAVRI